MSTIPFFCGKDCGGNACPLLATVENGCVTRVVNNPAGGRYIKGCRRGFDLPLEQYAPDRILTPLIRTGPRGSGQFRPAGWDEALSLTVNKLAEVRVESGSSAVLCRGSAGVIGALHATYAVLGCFMNLFGGCTRLTGNYSTGAAQFVLPYLLGNEWTVSGFDAATMQQAEMIILWGANVLETRQGAEVPQRLVEARQRGAQIVVVDPRRSATVKQTATWWLPCRPGTDAALMWRCSTSCSPKTWLIGRLWPTTAWASISSSAMCWGWMAVSQPPRSGPAAICGVAAEEIVRFARVYAAAKPAMLFPGYSIQRVYAGEETDRLTVALQLATGNFGRRGGSTGSINSMLPAPRVRRLPVPPISPQPSVPVVRWPDAILEGRRGGYPSDIRAVYNLGSNFLNQGGDIRKNMAAFEKLDFAVTHEVFLTLTARHCDVIFPTTTAFEKEDIGIPWADNYLLYKPQIVPPLAQARSDYDVMWELADRLGFGPAFSEGRSAAAWIEHFIAHSEIPDAAAFRETGIYLAPDQERVGLADFAANPARHPLSTPSGKVEIASERYQREMGFPAIPTWQSLPEDSRFPLRLISPKSPHFTRSQGSNIPALRRRAAHALSMHPQDAAQRGIGDGELARVWNAQGIARIPVRLTEEVMPGVVSLPEGMWVELDASGVDVGSAANMFTATDGTRPGTACIMHAVGVEVRRNLDHSQ